MPTSSSATSLVGSHYTIAPQPYVDIRRFSFFKEQQFDVREALSSSERISKVPRAALAVTQVLDAGLPPLSLAGPSSPRDFEGQFPSSGSWQLLGPSSSSHQFALSSPAPSALSIGARTPRPPPALKPLMSLSGDTIWTAGRSRAMEACDIAQLTFDAGSDESDAGEAPLRQNSDTGVAPKPPTLRLNPPQSGGHHQAALELQSLAAMTDHASLPFDSPSEHGGATSVKFSADYPTPTSTIPSSRRMVDKRQSMRVHPPIPPPPPTAPASQPRMSMSMTMLQESSASSSPVMSRRHSVRSKNACLARQLTKQSQELQGRLLALRETDAVHRQEISRIGARLLGGFGYVDEMNAYVNEIPPLPHGTHYKNLHPLDHVAEVRIDEAGSTHPMASAAQHDERLAEEANKEVRWTAVLKKDVNVAAAQEESRRSIMNRQVSPHRRRPTPPRLASSKASHHVRHAGSSPATGPSSAHILLEDVAKLADERLEQELRGRALASMNPKEGGRYSDIVIQKEEAEEETIRDILFTEPQHEKDASDSRPYKKKAKKKIVGAFGDRSAHKRMAVVDTSALEARMARGNTDTSLLGSKAAVDLRLFRKDPMLFSLTGEDTDPRAFPTFPFNKNELEVPREDGFGISIFDPKNVVEDKTYSERYHQQNLSDKLERTHVVRRLLNQVFAAHSGTAEQGDDEDAIAAKEDFDRWRRAAGALPTSAQRGDAADRIRKELAYTWHQVAKDHSIPEMPKL